MCASRCKFHRVREIEREREREEENERDTVGQFERQWWRARESAEKLSDIRYECDNSRNRLTHTHREGGVGCLGSNGSQTGLCVRPLIIDTLVPHPGACILCEKSYTSTLEHISMIQRGCLLRFI